MADDTVIPFRAATPPAPAELALDKAVEEQQERVWQLRALIQCVREAPSDMVDDAEAAMEGLIDLAGSIHSALNIETLQQRAAQLADAER